MDQGGTRRQHAGLALAAAVGIAYLAVAAGQPALLVSPRVAGTVGIVLGLYLGSLPAANSIDRLFTPRGARPRGRTAPWLALNGLVLVISLLVLALGAMQFTAAA